MKNLEKNLLEHFKKEKNLKTVQSSKISNSNSVESIDKKHNKSNEIESDLDENNDLLNNSSLPPIDSFFKLNNKVILVDEQKNLWELKIFKEFEKFKKLNKELYTDKDDMFNAFIDMQRQDLDENAINNDDNNQVENQVSIVVNIIVYII